MPGTDTLAYYEHSQITDRTNFTRLTTGADDLKLFVCNLLIFILS